MKTKKQVSGLKSLVKLRNYTGSPALQADSLPTEPSGTPVCFPGCGHKCILTDYSKSHPAEVSV